jgi:hypothetical protein
MCILHGRRLDSEDDMARLSHHHATPRGRDRDSGGAVLIYSLDECVKINKKFQHTHAYTHTYISQPTSHENTQT